MRYLIAQGLARPPIEVDLDDPPPCLFCEEPVTRPSMDGPLVCGSCDCGCNRDGSKWTKEQSDDRWAHRRAKIAEYRGLMIDRQLLAAKDLLAKDGADVTTAPRKILLNLIELCDALRAENDEWRGVATRSSQPITIGNTAGSEALHSLVQLRAALRAATDKLRPEMIRELRTLIDDPHRSRADDAYGPNQAAYERRAMPVLIIAVLALLAMHEEVVRLAKEEPFVKYELTKGEPRP